MITGFSKKFISSGDADELVQFSVNHLQISHNIRISISDGNKNTVEMTISDFEKLQKLFKAYQDASDLIETSLVDNKND